MKFFQKIQNWFLPTKENNFQPAVLSDRLISIFILLFVLIKVMFSFNLILVKQSSLFADISAQEILSLTNKVRQEYGLTVVQENSLLDQAALAKAQDMLTNQYFNHYSPAGISPWHWIDQSGYNYYYAGENLAMNFLDTEEVIQGWLNSPTHKENLLNGNYEDIGIAVLSGDFNRDGIDRILVVQMFGSEYKSSFLPVAEAQTEEPVAESVEPTEPDEEEALTEDLEQSEELATDIEESIITQQEESVAAATSSLAAESEEEMVDPTVLAQMEYFSETGHGSNTRNQVDMINKIIAGFIVILGAAAFSGVVLQQRKISFGSSELILRSVIIIVLGIAFVGFHLESLIGNLMIS